MGLNLDPPLILLWWVSLNSDLNIEKLGLDLDLGFSDLTIALMSRVSSEVIEFADKAQTAEAFSSP